MKKQYILSPRMIVQTIFLIIVALFVFSPYLFDKSSKAESLCPLGGLESLPQVIMGTNLLNHINPSNVVLMVAIIISTLLVGRQFCSWICPLGTLQEWMSNLGKKLKLTITVPEKVEKILAKLKYVILVLILFGTYTTATLVFRELDPFYALFHLANPALSGAFIIFALVLVLSIFIPRVWCRFLCPLGAFVNILSIASLVKPYRNEDKCISCGLCDRKCPVQVQVSKSTVLLNDSCNHCLDCMDACPKKGALDFKLGYVPAKKSEKEVNHNA
ncbi:MAG: 4Fe-4S ferredoxin iron-sulfur binding domain protein [Peptococcaceae bacterium]|jgi:polyferredoxin|nr:4Fe-4S ferredoxin iron-sulfur binding domain protein [Peptococcaceae bacterium]